MVFIIFLFLYAVSVDDVPNTSIFRPARMLQRTRGETIQHSVDYRSDEDIRESGGGILEFTPAKAGLDMTPANFDFETKDDKKKATTGLSSLAGT